jgi:tRNA wybutosine-synthesizing protein 2
MRQTPLEQIIEHCQSEIPKEYVSYLPRKWEKLGDVLMFKLPSELIPYQETIAHIYASVLTCKSVVKETGSIEGRFRVPSAEIIWGEANTETVHYENGIRFRLDPVKVMFSSGNMNERKRMSTIAHRDETVVDLFAGIGYFSIPLAVYSHPTTVVACEMNPSAFEYLRQNIVLNDVTHIIEPLFGDNRDTAPQSVADRVIMGYVGETLSYLPTALSCLKKEGGIIHYHDLFPDTHVPDRAMAHISDCVRKADKTALLLNVQRVKSFAPGISHYVFDIAIKT